jgi:hypothetical protein
MIMYPPMDKAFPSNSGKTNITITTEIHNILSINEIEDKIKVTVKLFLEWYDSRLIFRNIERKQYFNFLNENESAKIWKPEVDFINIEQMNFEYNIKPHVTIIMGESQSTEMADYSAMHSSKLYHGNKHKIQWFSIFRSVYYTFFIYMSHRDLRKVKAIKNTVYNQLLVIHLMFHYLLFYFSSNIICNFQMDDYPFDVQVCYLNMSLNGGHLVLTR